MRVAGAPGREGGPKRRYVVAHIPQIREVPVLEEKVAQAPGEAGLVRQRFDHGPAVAQNLHDRVDEAGVAQVREAPKPEHSSHSPPHKYKELRALLFLAQALYLLRGAPGAPLALTGALFRGHEVVLGWTWRTRFFAALHYLAHGRLCASHAHYLFCLLVLATEQRPMTRFYIFLCLRNMLLVLLAHATPLGADFPTLAVLLTVFIGTHG